MNTDRCLICGSPVAVSGGLFAGINDQWHCTRCAAWGDYANLSTEPVEAVRERLKRLTDSMGVEGSVTSALFDLHNPEPVYPNAAGWKGGETSREAAVTTDAEGLRALVMDDLRRNGPATADEIAARTGHDKLSIRPRLSELGPKGLGRVMDSHERRYNASGKRAIVWKVAPR